MRLLVSVRSAVEAAAALAGGADVIDAKEPAAGALGAVAPHDLAAIRAVVGHARPVTAALGDATDEPSVEALAHAFTAAGAAMVKLGLAGAADLGRATAMLRAAVRGARRAGGAVVAVAYADAARVGAPDPHAVLACAVDAGARGVLLDTADKRGPALPGLVAPDALAEWVRRAREASLLTALAGRVAADDLTSLRAIGPDVVGVRGAACDGGREGRVSAERVRALRARLAGGVRDVASVPRELVAQR